MTPTIILVRTQIGENIGTSARAMLNCSFDKLRLVTPREEWPNAKAISACSGADKVLDQAQLCSSVNEALVGFDIVFATSGRRRELNKPSFSLEEAIKFIRQKNIAPEKIAVLFGPERTGLTNEDLSLSDYIVEIPLNKSFRSLNLAQSVLLFCYNYFENFLLKKEEYDVAFEDSRQEYQAASKQDLSFFFDRLESVLEEKEFFQSAEKKPSTILRIKNLFQKQQLTKQDLGILHGIISCLVKR